MSIKESVSFKVSGPSEEDDKVKETRRFNVDADVGCSLTYLQVRY